MYLITAEIHNYVRCIKTVWNEYYISLPDGEHDFADVEQLIWRTLVLKLLQDTRSDVTHGEIVIIVKNSQATALVGRTSPSERATSWEEMPIGLEGQILLYDDFFDFRNWEDPRELKYVECWTTTLPKERLLVPTDEVDFYYRARQPN